VESSVLKVWNGGAVSSEREARESERRANRWSSSLSVTLVHCNAEFTNAWILSV
jgi:hypothetical protein